MLIPNLGTGSIKLELETADGILYSVSRAFGETPLVTNADGKPIDIRIGNDMHFGVDIYSQNQIEDIANSDYFQLQLIDKFIQKPLDELERQIRDAINHLEMNGQKILDRKKVIGDQTEATRELADITEKIRGFENADGGAQSEEMRIPDREPFRREASRPVSFRRSQCLNWVAQWYSSKGERNPEEIADAFWAFIGFAVISDQSRPADMGDLFRSLSALEVVTD